MVQFRTAIIRDLLSRSYRVIAIAQPDGISENDIQALGAEFVPIALSRSGVNPFGEMKSLFALISIFRRIRPDLLISYTIKPNIYALPICRMLGIPSIGVVTGLGYTFLTQSPVAWLARFLLGKSLLAASHVWFLNKDDMDLVCDHNADLRARSSVLPGEGIDTSFYKPRQMPPPPIKFLMIARILTDKGFHEYVSAAKLICAKFADVQFDLLGPLDPESPTGISREDIEHATNHPRINYLGPTNDVRPFMENAHCIVLPSYREGVSRVLLEAAAMGRPMIATDVPGCREVVIGGETGLLCMPRNVESLANCFEQFIKLDGRKRKAMGRAAQKDVAARFDDHIICARYHSMISELGIDGVDVTR